MGESKENEVRVEVSKNPLASSTSPTKILLALTGAALLVNYVETMIIPGVPTIQKNFGTTATIASWITSSYLIVGSAVAPLFGKLGDIYGKKKMFLISLVFYTAGVGLAGFSPSIYFLLFARGLQGIGFAIIPLSIAIITDIFPRERVAVAQGIISGTFAIGAAAGLVIGSFVVQDLGWQYAFHTALVLSIILFLITSKILQKDVVRAISKAVDYVGAAILMIGVTLVLVYVTEGPALGWLSANELLLLITGVSFTVGFFFFESKRENPLMRLSLFKIRNVLIGNLIAIVSGTTLFLLLFAVTYYAQLPKGYGLGLGIIGAGLTLAPSAIGGLISGVAIGRLLPRTGPKPILILGSAILGAGELILVLNRSSPAWVAIALVVALFGALSVLVPLVNMLSIALPGDSIAVGLGVETMLQNLGGAIGPVVATTIMATYITQYEVSGHPVPGVFLPNGTAFDIIFYIGIALAVISIAMSAMTKNYTFARKSNPVISSTADNLDSPPKE